MIGQLAKRVMRPLVQRRPLFFLAEALPASAIRTVDVFVAPDRPLGWAGTNVRLRVDSIILPCVLANGSWQPEDARFLADHAPASGECVLIDVGANAGLVTRQIARHLGARLSAAYCYEPDPVNFAALGFNLAPIPETHPLPFGLADAAGEAPLYRDAGNSGNFSLSRDAVTNLADEHGSIKLLDAASEIPRVATAHPSARFLWKSDTQGHDEVIVARVPRPFWSGVDAALVELWRIGKPAFDAAAVAAMIQDFPHRRFLIDGPELSTEEIMRFVSGPRDGASADLHLWR
jgi:FkbM family methyltransferase